MPTQSRPKVVPVTLRSGVLKGWTIRTNADIRRVYALFLRYCYFHHFFLFLRVLELEWPDFYIYRLESNRTISKSVRTAGRVVGKQPPLSARGGLFWPRLLLSAKGNILVAVSSKSLVFRVHVWQTSLHCGWSYVYRTTAVVSYYCRDASCTRTHFNYTWRAAASRNTMNREAFNKNGLNQNAHSLHGKFP